MWQDHIPVLYTRFGALQQARPLAHDPTLELVYQRYESHCREMIDGIQTLLLNLIEGQGYLRKKFKQLEQQIYIDMHQQIMADVEAAGDESIDSLPRFYYELQRIIDQLNGYCMLLRQDIRLACARVPALQRDRRVRQLNLILRQTIEAIGRLRAQSTALTRILGTGIDLPSWTGIDLAPQGFQGLQELIDTAGFSEAEKQRLLQTLGDD
jgi:hypothetical protein